MNSIGLIITLAGLIGGPLLAYFAVARRASGKIGSSEASDLWEESRAIRDWATTRISELSKTVDELQTKVEELEHNNTGLSLENGRLTNMLDAHEKTITELRFQMHRLSDENDTLKRDNIKLRKRVSELEGGQR